MTDPTNDTYGALDDVPVASRDQAVTDPALSIILDYFTAVLNARLAVAWQSVTPGKEVVRQSFTYDPEREWFSKKSLPAIYGYREGGKPTTRIGDDWQDAEDVLVLTWAFPLATQSHASFRRAILNGLNKVLDRAVMLLRDPAYVDPTDPAKDAPTYAAEPEAIKLSVATNVAAQSYSGAALDGARATATLSPPRGFEVSLSGSSAAFVNGSTIIATGTNALNLAQSVTMTIDTSKIPYVLKAGVDFKTVTQVNVAAQASGAGTISFGLGARKGYGSLLTARASLVRMWVTKAAHPYELTIRRPNQESLVYPAIRWVLGIRERLTRNPLAEGAVENDSAATGNQASLTTTRADDGTIFQTAMFPHGTVDPEPE